MMRKLPQSISTPTKPQYRGQGILDVFASRCLSPSPAGVAAIFAVLVGLLCVRQLLRPPQTSRYRTWNLVE